MQSRLKSMEQPMQSLVPAQPQLPIKSYGEVCRKWNRGSVTTLTAGTRMCVGYVGGAHPAIRCSRRGCMNHDGKPPTWDPNRADF